MTIINLRFYTEQKTHASKVMRLWYRLLVRIGSYLCALGMRLIDIGSVPTLHLREDKDDRPC